MKKLYYRFLVLIFVASGVAGCKLDPPIYPASGTTTGAGGTGTGTSTGGTGTGTGTGTGNTGTGGTGTGDGTSTDPNDGNGLPIEAASNIELQVNGTTYKYKQFASFGVVLPGSTEANNAGTPYGYIALQAYGSSIADAAGITVNNSTVGTFDLESIQFGIYTKPSEGTGKIKITKLTNNNIQGTFSVDVIDFNTNVMYKHCLGSFNINK